MKDVETRIDNEKKLFESFYVENVLKKRHCDQSKWPQIAISELTSVLEELFTFKQKLSQTKQKLLEIFQGTQAKKMPNQINRSKRENKRNARKRKMMREAAGARRFLTKISKSDISHKCFPCGFEKDKTAQYTLLMGNIKDNAEEHINPKRDEKYIDLLYKKNTFSTDVYNCIVKKKNMKQKSKKSKVIQDLHSTCTCSSEYTPESSFIAVDIHAPSFDTQSLDTSTDSNPFDFVDVMLG